MTQWAEAIGAISPTFVDEAIRAPCRLSPYTCPGNWDRLSPTDHLDLDCQGLHLRGHNPTGCGLIGAQPLPPGDEARCTSSNSIVQIRD